MTDASAGLQTVPAAAGPGLTVENPYCVRATVAGLVVARQGSMVAYRGKLALRPRSQGVRRLVKRAVTGEGVALMDVEGHGDIWFADRARNVVVVPGDGLTVPGRNVLCFEETLDYEIRSVKGAGMNGGGLFNCAFTGTGSLAITSHGQPFVLPVGPDAPVRVDTDAVIAWTASLHTDLHRSESVKAMLKGGSGEVFQLELRGEGIVVVQPSEGAAPSGKGKGVADTIGDLLS